MAEPGDPDSVCHRPWCSSPLEDDNLLTEILFRLPPWPSSLSIASQFCKRWRRLVTSPEFLRGFRAFHPALLGIFHNSYLDGPQRRFVSAVDPPGRVPATLFRIPCDGDHQSWSFRDCRHGLALLVGPVEALVWDPMTGAHHRVLLPPDVGDVCLGAVLCARRLVGDRRSRPFDVVLVWWKQKRRCRRAVAAVYSSVPRVWSEVVSPSFPSSKLPAGAVGKPGMRIGYSIYWLLPESSILELDMVRRRLAFVRVPVVSTKSLYRHRQLVVMDDGALGLAVVMKVSILVWKRDSGTSTEGWSLDRSVQLDRCLPLKRGMQEAQPSLLGFHEERSMIFVWIDAGMFMVQLELMQSRILCQGHSDFVVYPFSGFYTAGSAVEQDTGASGPVVDALEDFHLQPYTLCGITQTLAEVCMGRSHWSSCWIGDRLATSTEASGCGEQTR